MMTFGGRSTSNSPRGSIGYAGVIGRAAIILPVIAALTFGPSYFRSTRPMPSDAELGSGAGSTFKRVDDESSCDKWSLRFSDDFNGTAVDEDKWILYDSPGHAGNGLRRPSAITVEDGNLVITGRKIDGEIVSGGMGSRHHQLYGRFEARVRTEADPSKTMSGVLITWPADNYYPEGGENDYYETLNYASRRPFFTYIHYPDTSHEEIVHDADASEWHEVAMEWSAEKIDIFLDQEWAGSVTEPEAIPDFSHVLTIQLDAKRPEMGDNTVRMYVDWIRAYQENQSVDESLC